MIPGRIDGAGSDVTLHVTCRRDRDCHGHGEIIYTKAYVDIQKIVRDTVREIGYTRGKYGFDADTCGVMTSIDEQSADIALGVDKALEAKGNKMSEDDIEAIGAGDQGMMFGYASDETEEYMP